MAALLRPKGGPGGRANQKRQRDQVVADGNGLPLAVLLDSAQKAEIQLAQETLGLGSQEWTWAPQDQA